MIVLPFSYRFSYCKSGTLFYSITLFRLKLNDADVYDSQFDYQVLRSSNFKATND